MTSKLSLVLEPLPKIPCPVTLQLIGNGFDSSDFAWTNKAINNTFGSCNTNQTFQTGLNIVLKESVDTVFSAFASTVTVPVNITTLDDFVVKDVNLTVTATIIINGTFSLTDTVASFTPKSYVIFECANISDTTLRLAVNSSSQSRQSLFYVNNGSQCLNVDNVTIFVTNEECNVTGQGILGSGSSTSDSLDVIYPSFVSSCGSTGANLAVIIGVTVFVFLTTVGVTVVILARSKIRQLMNTQPVQYNVLGESLLAR